MESKNEVLKKYGGRYLPKIKSVDDTWGRRTDKIVVCVTPEEKAKLTRQACQNGFADLSKFVRSVILG